MPSTYHSKSKDIHNLLEIQAQQDIIMLNTLPNIIKLINSTHTSALTIQHFRTIERYNQYINIVNSNFKEHLNNLPIDLKTKLLNSKLNENQISCYTIYAYMCMFFVSYESLQCALKNLAPIIQNFLLQLSLDTYKIKFIDGISTTISMTNDTLDIFRMKNMKSYKDE
jgi:hypothetical protein